MFRKCRYSKELVTVTLGDKTFVLEELFVNRENMNDCVDNVSSFICRLFPRRPWEAMAFRLRIEK